MSVIRNAVKTLGRNRSFPRRLPAEFGGAKMFASTEGGLKYLSRNLRNIDRPLFDFVAQHVPPGGISWDIGANLGLFALSAAGKAGPSGHVLALEPDIWLAGLLRRSARANFGTIAPIDVLPAAVAESVSVDTFLVAGGNRATNALNGHGHSVTMGGVRERHHVPVLTLDLLLEVFPAPDVVKVDVEGAEARVLLGATNLLSVCRPILNIEVEAAAASQVGTLLKSAGYVLTDGETGETVATPAWCTVAWPRP